MTQMKVCNRCTKKKANKYYESIKPQKIITELNNGQLLNDDYYGRSYELLPDIDTSVPPKTTQATQNTFHIYELHKILDPTFSSLEHGFKRMEDGLWYMATKTTLENVTGEMIEWWFNHCDSTDRFKWWHPISNVHGEYDPTFYAVQPEDRLAGHSIGHRFTCIKKMYSSGSCVNASDDINNQGEEVMQHIDYLHPAEFINTDQLASAGITACIIGKISYRDHHLGEVSVGHICHIVTEHVGGGVSLVTRMWLGYVDKTDLNFPSPGFVNYVGNTLLYRYLKFSYTFIRNEWVQMVQEMNCLVALLPDFYAREVIELELRKQRNMELLREGLNAFEEFSEEEEEVEEGAGGEGQHYEEESLPDEESMPDDDDDDEDGEKDDRVEQRPPTLVTSSTSAYVEESMSEDEEEEKKEEEKGKELPVPTTTSRKTSASKSKNKKKSTTNNTKFNMEAGSDDHHHFYEYDTNDDDEGKDDDDSFGSEEGESGLSMAKNGGKLNHIRKEKKTVKGKSKGKNARSKGVAGGVDGQGQGSAPSSSSQVTAVVRASPASSRVGKGIGV